MQNSRMPSLLPPRALAGALAAGALTLAVGLAAAEDTWSLQRRILRGAQLSADEEQEERYDYRITSTGQRGDPGSRTSVSGHAVERTLRRYLQKVVLSNPDGEFRIDRKYEKSVKEVSKPGSEKRDAYATELQGKVVSIIGANGSWDASSETFDLSGEARNDVCFSEQIYALLPKKPVRLGEQWGLRGAEIGPLFFPGDYNDEGFKIQAYGVLKQVTKFQNTNCAHIGLTLRLEVQKTESAPGKRMEVKGYAFFSLEDGVFLELDLSGPTQIDSGIEGADRFEATGKWRLKVRAKVLAKGQAPEMQEPGGGDGGGGEGGDDGGSER
ncbi:MAG: hypothetical protein HYZ53_11310 [Planctomycetes bacterium]|nr:hypothetical protein [Planctomycetota bacterium]